jgi:hypothetical protein
MMKKIEVLPEIFEPLADSSRVHVMLAAMQRPKIVARSSEISGALTDTQQFLAPFQNVRNNIK